MKSRKEPMTSNDEDKKRMVQVSIPATVSLKKSEYDAEVELSILIANTLQFLSLKLQT